jgi:hypothetical protein
MVRILNTPRRVGRSHDHHEQAEVQVLRQRAHHRDGRRGHEDGIAI